ncbi:MAG: hypothetical protein KDB00_14050, partial [Planctomycetales bacterium]|nr:hypothetical protein [Planctomycetales bacterium]
MARRRRSYGTRKKRRQIVEQLESRQLLAGDWNDQRAELINEIDKLSTFADHVESASSLSQPLAVFGNSFNDRLDFSTALSSEFVTPLKTFLQDAGRATDAQSVVDYLKNELPGDVVVSVSTSAFGDERVFDTTLYLTSTVDYEPQLDPAAATAGLTFDSTQSAAEFGVTLDLRFGSDTADDFFAMIRRMDFSVVDAAEVRATDATPDFSSIDRDIPFTLLVNESTSISATLPANTAGNVTPLVNRLNTAIRQPLIDAGFAGAIEAVDSGGRLAFRSFSPSVQKLELSGTGELALLGFATQTTSAKSFAPDVEYGLVSLESVGGGISIGGELDVRANSGTDDRFSSAELIGNPELSVSSHGFVRMALDVRPSTDTLFGGMPVINATSGTLFRGQGVSVSLQSFEPVQVLHDQATETLRQGFAAITQFGSRLETETLLANEMPALDATFAESAGVETVLREKLQSKLETLLQTNSHPTWDEVADALQTDGMTVTRTSSRDQLLLNVNVKSDPAVKSHRLVLRDDVMSAGLTATNELPLVDLNSMTDWQLQIDIDRRRTASPLDAFSVTFDQIMNRFTTNDSVNFEANVGFLGVSVDGTVNVDATLQHRIAQAGEAVSAGRLLSDSMASLISTETLGDFDASLGLTGTIGGVTLTDGSVVIDLAGGEVFDGQSQLQLALIPAGGLADFANLSAEEMASGIQQLAGWLGDFAEEKLGGRIPLAESLHYADIVKLQSVFEELVVSKLVGGDDRLAFSNAQELDALDFGPSAGISNPAYDAATKTLTFDVEFNKAVSIGKGDDLEFNFGVGDFVGFTTQGEVTLTPTVNGRFRLGIDMRPLGAGDAATTISGTTTLAALGIETAPGSDVRISLRDGSVFEVDFDGAVDLDDVITRLENASPTLANGSAALDVSLRDENSITVGLQLTDRSEDTGSEFTVRA